MIDDLRNVDVGRFSGRLAREVRTPPTLLTLHAEAAALSSFYRMHALALAAALLQATCVAA